jgi:hypothetical protein
MKVVTLEPETVEEDGTSEPEAVEEMTTIDKNQKKLTLAFSGFDTMNVFVLKWKTCLFITIGASTNIYSKINL